MHISASRDELMQAKGEETAVRTNFHPVGGQQEIPQGAQDLLIVEPGLFGQRFAGLLQGVRLAAHPFAIRQAVFSL